MHEATLSATQGAADDEGAAATLVGLAIAHRRAGDHQREHDLLTAALGMLNAGDHRHERIGVLNRLTASAIKATDHDAAAKLSTEAMKLHDQDYSPAILARTHLQSGLVWASQGDLDRASSSLLKARRLFEQTGDGPGILQAETELAIVRRRQGKHQDAITLLLEVVASADTEITSRRLVLPALVNLSEINCDQGQYEHVDTYARQAIGLCHPSEDVEYMVRAMLVRVRTLAATGLQTSAITEAQRLTELISGTDAPASADAVQQLKELQLPPSRMLDTSTTTTTQGGGTAF